MTNTLKPWYEVAIPHEDIRASRFDEAIFAANIWSVVTGSAPKIYIDPEEFFKKTYMTDGLKAIMERVSKSLSGGSDSGDRIVSLQTSFGGGKTHTLVALWHLVKNGHLLKNVNDPKHNINDEVLSRIPEGANVAVFTNATCDTKQGRNVGKGITTHTLWGELAFQLGGEAAYNKIKDNDETKTAPLGIFTEVLKEAGPSLILLDEIADYCSVATGEFVGDATLADQTISFIQQLTEAVQQVPHVALIATLPASKFEVAQSQQGQEVFTTLEKRFHRLGADIKPVAENEIYEIIRARLFESIGNSQEIGYPKIIADAYFDFYLEHKNDVPSEATKEIYKELIRKAYPFHPMLIDALYTRWGAHPDFQRTRGVLRMLASIVGDLWKKRDSSSYTQHMIMPSHIRWDLDPMQGALTKYWGQEFQAVIGADVTGQQANAANIDDEKGGDYKKESISEGIASTILLGSFPTGQIQRSGFSQQDIKLATSKIGIHWNLVDSALIELENRCFYLHSTSGGREKRYWFGTKPTLNKLLVQYKREYEQNNYFSEIVEEIKNDLANYHPTEETWHPIVDPQQDLPEQKALTLLILPPSVGFSTNDDDKQRVEEYIRQLSTKCGSRERLYRNTLIFLTPTSRGVTNLQEKFRERKALETIKNDYGDQLDNLQYQDLSDKLSAARTGVKNAIGSAYAVMGRVFGENIEIIDLSNGRANIGDHLHYLWTKIVNEEEWIIKNLGTVTLQKHGLVPKEGGISLDDAINAFLRFNDKPMIATKTAVTNGLIRACSEGFIGIARGTDLSHLITKHCKQQTIINPSEEGVWIIPPFEPEITKTEESLAFGGSFQTVSPKVTLDVNETPLDPGKKKVRVSGNIPIENWKDLFTSFVSPAGRDQLGINLNIDFEFQAPSGKIIDKTKSEAMKESAAQLGLKYEEE